MSSSIRTVTRGCFVSLRVTLTLLLGIFLGVGTTFGTTNSGQSENTGIELQHESDYNGDGRTDFSVVRNTGGGPSGQITWYTKLNGGGDAESQYPWGLSGDFFMPTDFDGDNKTDICIWRAGPAGTAAFYYIRSSDSTFVIVPFGQTGDDPTIGGDYTGDGLADPAIYRPGLNAGLPSTWWYRASSGPNAGLNVPVQWGQNGDFVAPGDYDGDGRNDFVVQRNAGGGQARFWTLLANGTTPNTVVFGTPTDVIVPGDYDGDGKTDIATVRGIGGQITWFVLPSSGTPYTRTVFGASATDFPVQGDYDGDGKTDPAIWRPSASPSQTAFWYLGSASGVGIVRWGQNGDFPTAGWNRH